jgi:UDP-N-acetyl-D-glucosamine/UDP-N-acetyl-D-galactosamine dehydrogenase
LSAFHDKISPADAVIFAVAHDAYVTGGWKLVQRRLKPNAYVVLDVKGLLDWRGVAIGFVLAR